MLDELWSARTAEIGQKQTLPGPVHNGSGVDEFDCRGYSEAAELAEVGEFYKTVGYGGGVSPSDVKLTARRWRIENMFQRLEGALNSEITALGHPRAALLAFGVAVLAYKTCSR